MGIWLRMTNPDKNRRKKAWAEPLTAPPAGALPPLLDDKLLMRGATVNIVVPSAIGAAHRPGRVNLAGIRLDDDDGEDGLGRSLHGLQEKVVKEAGHGTLLLIKAGGTLFTSHGGRPAMELRMSGADVDILPPKAQGAAIGANAPVARIRLVGQGFENPLGVGSKITITVPQASGAADGVHAPPLAVVIGRDDKARYKMYLGDGGTAADGGDAAHAAAAAANPASPSALTGAVSSPTGDGRSGKSFLASAASAPFSKSSSAAPTPIARFARRKLGTTQYVWEVEGTAGVNLGLLVAITSSLDGVLETATGGAVFRSTQQEQQERHAAADKHVPPPLLTTLTERPSIEGQSSKGESPSAVPLLPPSGSGRLGGAGSSALPDTVPEHDVSAVK